MGPYGGDNINTLLLPPVFSSFLPNFMINMVVMEEYSLLYVAIWQKLKLLWHFEFFVNTGPYGAGDLLLSYIFHLISAKLYEDIAYHGRINALTFLGN